MSLRGEDERQLGAEPDSQQGGDTYPRWNKDEQAWSTNNTPVAYSEGIYSPPIDDLPDLRHQRHAECYNQIANGKEAKGVATKTIPGKSSCSNPRGKATTGGEFIKAHEAHTT